MAHRLVNMPYGDRGKTRIPVLTFKEGEVNCTASTNQEKGRILARNFFPTKPCADASLAGHKYPKVCSHTGKITHEQICMQLQKLKPYKVPGPDSISNIVLTKLSLKGCITYITPCWKRALCTTPGKNSTW